MEQKQNKIYNEVELNVQQQETYSKQLVALRHFCGSLYILAPHAFLQFFYAIYISVVNFFALWITLISGKYPNFAYEDNLNFLHWQLRLNSSLNHLTDEYPTFGLHAKSNSVTLNVQYPENVSRSSVLVRLFFGGFYCGIPHGIVLFFRNLFIGFFQMFNIWIVLFTGKYPDFFFQFIEGTFRWQTRVSLYLMYMTQEYPPFSSAE